MFLNILFFSCVCLFVPGVYVIKIIIINGIKNKLEELCLPTPLTLASGGGGDPDLPPSSFSVHQFRHSSGVCPQIPWSDNVVRMWVTLKRLCVSCVWVLQRGHSGDRYDLASTLCEYDFRKDDLFVLSWTRMGRVRRGSISPELIMCSAGVCRILLLPLVARCMETIDVCIWRMFVFMSLVVTVWGNVGCVAAVVKYSGF